MSRGFLVVLRRCEISEDERELWFFAWTKCLDKRTFLLSGFSTISALAKNMAQGRQIPMNGFNSQAPTYQQWPQDNPCSPPPRPPPPDLDPLFREDQLVRFPIAQVGKLVRYDSHVPSIISLV